MFQTCDQPCRYSIIFVTVTHEPNIQPNHMKQLYTSLLTGAALLVAGAVSAQKSHSLQSIQNAIHPGHGTIDVRGGAPPNDECTGAVNQNLAIGGTVTFSGDNTNATDAEGFGFGQVWESFTITQCADLTLSYCGTAPAFGNAFLSLFMGCPNTTFYPAAGFDVTTCSDGNVTIFFTSVPPGQYYYAVMNDAANAAVGPYTIAVSAVAPAIGCAANDECANAIALSAGANCVGTLFLTTGASESMDPIDCAGFTSGNGHDVWFSFVATNASMTVGVTGFNESDAMVELFSGSCGSLVSLGCADATFPQAAGEQTSEELIQTGLTVGTTYYVRVYDWGHASPDHSFEICVVQGEGTNIGIEENATATDWSIYPNPGTGVFNLQYNGANTTVSIEVIDITGRVVYTQQTSMAAGTNHPIDLSGVAIGNYNVRLIANGVRTEQRLMVK
jgi:hypothetical protein